MHAGVRRCLADGLLQQRQVCLVRLTRLPMVSDERLLAVCLHLAAIPTNQALVGGPSPPIPGPQVNSVALKPQGIAPLIPITQLCRFGGPRGLQGLAPARIQHLVEVQPDCHVNMRRQVLHRQIVCVVPAPRHDVAAGHGDAGGLEQLHGVIG